MLPTIDDGMCALGYATFLVGMTAAINATMMGVSIASAGRTASQQFYEGIFPGATPCSTPCILRSTPCFMLSTPSLHLGAYPYSLPPASYLPLPHCMTPWIGACQGCAQSL